jgi:hypothetical protein
MNFSFPAFARLPHVNTCVLVALLLIPATAAVPVHADEYEIIVENNLFHDQRQKWEMEVAEKRDASQGGPGERQEIEQISLFGTVIKDSQSYAIMRVSKPATNRRAGRRAARNRSKGRQNDKNSAAQLQDTKRPYAVGDFVGGYQVVEIRADLVLLRDPYDNTRYEVFMNDTQAERTVVRTEIPEEKPAVPKPGRPSSPRPPISPEESAKSSAVANRMRQRFERDVQRLRDENNPAAVQKAKRDWKKLQPLIPSLDEKEQRELMRLKSEFEKLSK